MGDVKTIWSARLDLGGISKKQKEHDRVVQFIHDQLQTHGVELEDMGFMGTVYGPNHVSARVPGLTELAVGRLCRKHKDRYLRGSPQRLNLVDERQAGIDKMIEAFCAFEASEGVICWYGEGEFEIALVSSSARR